MVKENWDTIITSKRKFWEIDVRSIYRFRFLVYLFVRRDFVANFKQTILGPIWFLVQPVMTTIVFVAIFGSKGFVPSGAPAALYFLSAIVVWNFFSEVFTKTSNTFIQNSGIFGKVYFPRLVVPISLVFSGMMKFLVQFLVLIGLCVYYSYYAQVTFNWAFILITPLSIIITGVMAMAGGILASSLTSKYRDFNHLVGFGLQLVMYFTILFPLSNILKFADKARADQGVTLEEVGYSWSEMMSMANPMSGIVESFRIGYCGTGLEYFSPLYYCYSATFAVVLLFVSVGIFNKTEKNFMDTV